MSQPQTLGVILDSSLSFNRQVNSTGANFFQIRTISKIRHFLSPTDLEIVIHAQYHDLITVTHHTRIITCILVSLHCPPTLCPNIQYISKLPSDPIRSFHCGMKQQTGMRRDVFSSGSCGIASWKPSERHLKSHFDFFYFNWV